MNNIILYGIGDARYQYRVLRISQFTMSERTLRKSSVLHV